MQRTAIGGSMKWLVFYGTLTSIVDADDEGSAFDAFLSLVGRPQPRTRWHKPEPYNARMGRYVPPAREEVTIRPPMERDRGWIEESEDQRFLALLDDLNPSAAVGGLQYQNQNGERE